jgi:hypothetical protein
MTEKLFDHITDPCLKKQAEHDTGQLQVRLATQLLPQQLDERRVTAEQRSALPDDELLQRFLNGELY